MDRTDKKIKLAVNLLAGFVLLFTVYFYLGLVLMRTQFLAAEAGIKFSGFLSLLLYSIKEHPVSFLNPLYLVMLFVGTIIAHGLRCFQAYALYIFRICFVLASTVVGFLLLGQVISFFNFLYVLFFVVYIIIVGAVVFLIYDNRVVGKFK